MTLSDLSEGKPVVYGLQKGKEKKKELCRGYKRLDGAVLETKQSVGRRDVPLTARDKKQMSLCRKLASRFLFGDVLWGL